MCLTAACSKEQPPSATPDEPSPPRAPSPSSARDPEPPTAAEPAPSEAPATPTPSPDDCAGVIAAVHIEVVREVLERHGFSHDFAENHTAIKAGELEPGSDSVDSTTYSACVDNRRCINVSTTTTGDPRYPNRCVRGYDHLYGHDALGIGRADLAVMVISTEDEVSEDELRAQQARILDDLIAAISN